MTTKDITAKYFVSLCSCLPLNPSTQKTLETKIAPIVGKIAEFIEKLIPIIQNFYGKCLKFWESLAPYKPHLLIPSFAGLIMCFFGGSYLTLIAAAEAYRMCGYDSTVKCIEVILDDLKKVAAENKKDDKEDKDGDGIADTLQITNAQLIQRKTLLFMRTVDPKRLSDAISIISASFFTVVATLKLQFAKTITLGTAIGDTIEKPVVKYLLPVIEKAVPPEYRKWAQPVIKYTIKSFAISIAWTVQRILSAFHSAIRGGLLFSRNMLTYLSEMKIIEIDHEETYLDEFVGYGLALLGIYFQLSLGFALPFILRLILFPFSILEYLLIWAVNSSV